MIKQLVDAICFRLINGPLGGQPTNITVNVNSDKDDVGRTIYQVGQNIARQLRAVER